MADNADRPPPPSSATGLTQLLEADRERAIARLSESFSRDELSVDEYERRVSLVYGAATRPELEKLSADLPAAPTPDPELVAAPLRVSAVLSNVVRPGPSALPKQLHMRSWGGNIEIDLSRSSLQPGVTELEVDVVLGNLEIVLPEHAHVDPQMSAVLASFDNPRRSNASSALPAAVPPAVIRFTGRIVLGNVSVRFR